MINEEGAMLKEDEIRINLTTTKLKTSAENNRSPLIGCPSVALPLTGSSNNNKIFIIMQLARVLKIDIF